ncbi:MAG: MarR family winged helix-turn-helix transcriptional regulator [Rhodocyclaceae bacterium]|jgi:DNA-binding MarR family transcriptional regulator|nr:MarR family winged helix-turn-helix transcriptional regulator [Rhodocyclaceae bacterium]
MNRRDPIPTTPEPGAAAVTQLVLRVFRLNGVLLHRGDQLVAPLGLTSARWQMLGAIALAGTPLTAPQIAEAMGVTRQGAQKQLNMLLEQGLVEARPNPAHRRSPLYVLTPQGLALYRQADALWAAQAVELAALIPSAQAHAATGTLETMLHELHTPNLSSKVES